MRNATPPLQRLALASTPGRQHTMLRAGFLQLPATGWPQVGQPLLACGLRASLPIESSISSAAPECPLSFWRMRSACEAGHAQSRCQPEVAPV